nr:hypothetical protein [uncultured Lachnoclostridium sp.]
MKNIKIFYPAGFLAGYFYASNKYFLCILLGLMRLDLVRVLEKTKQ